MNLNLNIAALNILVKIPEKSLSPYLSDIGKKYSDIYNKSNPDITLEVFLKNPGYIKKFRFRDHSGGKLYNGKEEDIFITREYSLVIDKNLRQAFAYVHNSCKSSNIDSIVITTLRICISLKVIESKGFPIHSSSIEFPDSGGFLFSGNSNSGKTTIARMLEHSGTVLNDEFNVIIPHKSEFRLYSTPFTRITNPYSENRNTVLKKIYILCKSKYNKTKPIPHEKRVFSLISNIYSIPVNQSYWSKTIDNAYDIALNVPIEMLYFSNRDTSGQTIKNILE